MMMVAMDRDRYRREMDTKPRIVDTKCQTNLIGLHTYRGNMGYSAKLGLHQLGSSLGVSTRIRYRAGWMSCHRGPRGAADIHEKNATALYDTKVTISMHLAQPSEVPPQ